MITNSIKNSNFIPANFSLFIKMKTFFKGVLNNLYFMLNTVNINFLCNIQFYTIPK